MDEAKADILEAQQRQDGKQDPAVLSVAASLNMPDAYPYVMAFVEFLELADDGASI